MPSNGGPRCKASSGQGPLGAGSRAQAGGAPVRRKALRPRGREVGVAAHRALQKPLQARQQPPQRVTIPAGLD